jgi:hypothetical protein
MEHRLWRRRWIARTLWIVWGTTGSADVSNKIGHFTTSIHARREFPSCDETTFESYPIPQHVWHRKDHIHGRYRRYVDTCHQPWKGAPAGKSIWYSPSPKRPYIPFQQRTVNIPRSMVMSLARVTRLNVPVGSGSILAKFGSCGLAWIIAPDESRTRWTSELKAMTVRMEYIINVPTTALGITRQSNQSIPENLRCLRKGTSLS